jgi:hypothetical protein
VPEISTKTIIGYEQGLYDWLAVKEWRDENNMKGTDFALATIGGGSSQVVFPCVSNCVNAKTVVVDSREIDFFIHSFLKLGTTKLPGALQSSDNIPPSCEWGIAEKQAKWEKKHCLVSIKSKLVDALGAIKDPSMNRFVKIPKHDHLTEWYLTGSSPSWMWNQMAMCITVANIITVKKMVVMRKRNHATLPFTSHSILKPWALKKSRMPSNHKQAGPWEWPFALPAIV